MKLNLKDIEKLIRAKNNLQVAVINDDYTFGFPIDTDALQDDSDILGVSPQQYKTLTNYGNSFIPLVHMFWSKEKNDLDAELVYVSNTSVISINLYQLILMTKNERMAQEEKDFLSSLDCVLYRPTEAIRMACTLK